ncbi:helix-turn-helix transcriptional regulator [Micromonospora sp. NPDC049044]|uniref:helix-turn-helix domain-containing protein n=1 Tax=Micromonospora sp. NPDC049044 TaxID=3154827 RepID=UPI0033E3C657
MFADPTGTRAATFAAVFVALYVAHQVADHWVQTQHQADCKGQPGWPGRIACAAHVVTYTLTALLALVFVIAGTGLRLDAWGVAIGLMISAVSHYIADRRTPLRRLADALGKNPAWLERGGGLYALDQSWHVGFLFVAALFCAV